MWGRLQGPDHVGVSEAALEGGAEATRLVRYAEERADRRHRPRPGASHASGDRIPVPGRADRTRRCRMSPTGEGTADHHSLPRCSWLNLASTAVGREPLEPFAPPQCVVSDRVSPSPDARRLRPSGGSVGVPRPGDRSRAGPRPQRGPGCTRRSRRTPRSRC